MKTSEYYQNGMIKYTSRDYESIMEEFWELVPKLTDLWKPEADADPGVVLGKYLASIASMLGVNLDWLANELFAPSVTQRKNAEKLFDLIGYNLGWYTAAKTEVTFKNNTTQDLTLNFSFNGNNFATLNAYTDITQQPRVITYNIIPFTNVYGAKDTRSKRETTTDNVDIFTKSDKVRLAPGGSVTRVAVEGELRQISVSVADIKSNNYIINLPSQHVDTTAIWVVAKPSLSESSEYLKTQWIQVDSPSEFIVPEPRFAVTYDSYSNARIQVSNYLNQLENYDNNWIMVYWLDCSGVIGSVGKNVLSNYLEAATDGDTTVSDSSGDITISNLSNTVELPHTHTVTGKSPETAKEAYYNSRNYINTFDSLITLPDFNRFLNREAGVDCGLVIDCQKALEINLAIYNDKNLTDTQKSKMYITNNDFPASGDTVLDWGKVLNLGFDPTDPQKFVFAANFKKYTAMCYAIHNDFQNSDFGQSQTSNAQIRNVRKFIQYKPPIMFIDNVVADYKPLQAMTVELEFGYVRVFPWYCVGTITPYSPVDSMNAENIINKVKEDLALYFSPANRQIGQKPTLMEVVDVIEKADDRIRHFDPGAPGTKNYGIVWDKCDIEYFNPISFAQYETLDNSTLNIRINPDYLIES